MKKGQRRSGAQRGEQNRYRETGGTVYRDHRNTYANNAYPGNSRAGQNYQAGNYQNPAYRSGGYAENGRQNSYYKSGRYQSYDAAQRSAADPYQTRGQSLRQNSAVRSGQETRARLERQSSPQRSIDRGQQETRERYGAYNSDYYMYTANAVARDYQEEEVVVPQETVRVEKQERPFLLQHISTLLIVFVLGLSLVVQYTYIQNLGYQVGQSKTELKQVQEQNEKLRRQISAAGELQAVEAFAINNMGMHKPADWEIIYLPQSSMVAAPDASDVTEPDAPATE